MKKWKRQARQGTKGKGEGTTWNICEGRKHFLTFVFVALRCRTNLEHLLCSFYTLASMFVINFEMIGKSKRVCICIFI